MTKAPKQMRLTADHVARVARDIADPGPKPRPGFRPAGDDDYRALLDGLLAARADDAPVWVFAYGSLIWKPGFEFVEQHIGVARGWHRSFCLGWDYRFRGNEEEPALMLALDRGGACKGVVYRLADDGLDASLDTLMRREISLVPMAQIPRWISVQTDAGQVRAIAFTIERQSGRYIGGLANEDLADVLARAAGHWGSMADYLFSTVSHLENLGIHDGHLWTLQELVAERLDAQDQAES